MTFQYRYRKSHCGDKIILRRFYLHNGISYTCNTTSLYWIRVLNLGSWTWCLQIGWNIHIYIWASNQVGCSCTWQRSLVKPTLGPPKKFQHPTRAEEVVITRLRIGHTKATKSHILSWGPPTGCHHCGQTLTIDHMLLECPLLQECLDEYYTVDSLNALFETIPETCIVEFLREAGFFYQIWCNLLTSTSPQTWTIWSDLSNCLEN